MLAKLATELRLQYSSESAPPRILRENMALAEGDTTALPVLDDAIELWFGWQREDGHAPDWSRFRPFNHPDLLPHVMLYERIGDRFRCAIVGDDAVSNLPIKLARRFLDEVMPPENLADVTMRLTTALSTEKPNFVEKTMAWQIGHDLRCYRALQLPFRAPEGGNARVLSIMNFQSTPV